MLHLSIAQWDGTVPEYLTVLECLWEMFKTQTVANALDPEQ